MCRNSRFPGLIAHCVRREGIADSLQGFASNLDLGGIGNDAVFNK